MKKTYTIGAETELQVIASDVLELLREQPPEAAAVLALHGDLGAGKTTFMQTLAKSVSVTDTVVSPTFVVMKQYDASYDRFEHLVHIDAYRIEDIDEMRPLRFAEILSEKTAIIAIEWAEQIESLLPATTLHLDIVIEGEQRVITLRHA